VRGCGEGGGGAGLLSGKQTRLHRATVWWVTQYVYFRLKIQKREVSPPVSPPDEMCMQLLHRIVRDEQGGEVLEYALIAGLIVVAAIAVITSVGGKVLARWQSMDSSM
jgi:Flp pilus assembly pilin Flp